MTPDELARKVCPLLSVPMRVEGQIANIGGQKAQGVSILRVRCMGPECVMYLKDPEVNGEVRCGACSS